MLSERQIRLLLDRLSWVPVYEDNNILLAKKGSGYSPNQQVAATQAALSIMLGVVHGKA